jgi:MFS transporter, DHA1 family, tetracycline resistance protein
MKCFKSNRSKSLFTAFFVICLDNFGFGLVFVLFAPLLLDPSYGFFSTSVSFATKNLYLGILLAAFPLMQFFGAPLFGDFSDVYGRKKALYLTIIGTLIGYFFSGFAITVKDYYLLLLSRIITGFFAGNLSISLAIISDLSKNEKTRAKNLGYVTIVFGLTWPLAILAGGYLSDPSLYFLFSPQLPFWLAVILSCILLYAVKKLYQEPIKVKQKVRIDFTKAIGNIIEAFQIKPMRIFLLILLLWTFSWMLAVQWYMPYAMEQFSISQELAASGLFIQGFFWLLGGSILKPYLLKRYNTLKIALLTFFCTSLFLAFSSFSYFFWPFSILYGFSAVFGAVSLSASLNLISLSASAHIQGKAMGMGQSMIALGSIFVPFMGGILGNTDIRLLYPISAIIMSLGFCLLLKKNWEKKK